ncbi:MAG: trimethylamine methyltransferase family protein [Pseudomonadales bacterium]|nr:trimethylamine methyltransferase family protein [Pseudomonadales bacterium]MDP7358736.1 trimethylamine methyltransferase family protein [Pseudomonadales bacterium]MDP7596695.1 trimethylamine methyltransferase family protein [Pseudomonadales bacterium]HJN50341.1 trimethylamine methyltransferase family protein [Pseudomonadales bacterium]
MRPTLSILSDDLIAQILSESKRVMSETGMEVRGERLRHLLIDHGLTTDPSGKRILIPADVVESAIATAPKSFTLYDRDDQPHAEIGGNEVHFVPGSSGINVLDHRSNEVRLATSTDFLEYARLCDGLEHIAYMATAFSTNKDVEPQVSDAWRLYMCLVTSKKPVVSGAFSEHGVTRMAEMMQLFRSDPAHLVRRPMSIFTITPAGRFSYGEVSCQNLLDCIAAGIPIEFVPVTLMGLIAPVTLVGALVFHCVDVLTGITMAQLVKPGTPVLFGGAPATFHMQAATSPMAAIEALRLDVAYVAIAKSLGLPTQAYMALSDSKLLDAQAGAETFGGALLAAMAGVNSISGPGMLDFVLTFSLAKLVFDNEMCGQALHFIRDINSLDDLPTTDLVSAVLESEHLVTAPHTLKHWPHELYLSSGVLDRENRQNWAEGGSKELLQRAGSEVESRLAAYTPIETDAAIDAEMRRLIQEGLNEQRDLPVIPS